MADKIVNPNYPEINHDLLFNDQKLPLCLCEDEQQAQTQSRQRYPLKRRSSTLWQ